MGIKKIVSTLLAAGVVHFSFLPFGEVLDPFGVFNGILPQTHLEKRWKTTYDRPPGPGEISIQWLGTTGFKVQKGDFILLIDPYLTRAPLPQLFIAPLVPNAKLLEEKIPKADYIFVTDSHFDHFMDVPAIALRTGAKVVGSSTTAKLLRIHKVPEAQIVEVKGGETLQAGPFTVQPAKATHGSIYFFKPFCTDINEKAQPPLYVWDYGNLENLCYRFQTDSFRFFVTSGADVDEKALPDFQSDLVIANVTTLPAGYIAKLMRLTNPKVVLPTHYDNFFEPFEHGVVSFPIADLKVFCEEVQKAAPTTATITLDFFQEYRSNIKQR